jgi:hypothetical protein
MYVFVPLFVSILICYLQGTAGIVSVSGNIQTPSADATAAAVGVAAYSSQKK